MSQQKKFDFIIPIGATCMVAHNLREIKRQRESLPFDWVWIVDFQTIIHFIATRFTDFMKKEHLTFLKNNGDADVYRDTTNKTEFWHDFMVGNDFNQAYEQNFNKYQRRIERMYLHLNRAKKVLWVRMVKISPHKQKNEDDYMFETSQFAPQQLIDEYTSLQNVYPQKKFELLLFYLYDEPHQKIEYDITPEIHICELYNDEKFGWKGDMVSVSDVLKKYNLTFSSKLYYAFNTLKYKIRKLYLQISSICGSKNNKKLLKQRD